MTRTDLRLRRSLRHCGLALALAIPASVAIAPITGTAGGASSSVVGKWRIYSNRLDYDAGGGGVNQPFSSRTLVLRGNRTWRYGSSKGRWSTSRITSSDWKRWGSEPYGPTTKIVLKGWAGKTATGPIERSSRVDFIWVIYRVKPPTVSRPGTMSTKFGRVRP